MKLPTLTAITLASAVLAAAPAFAAGTPDATAPLIPPPGTAAQPAGGAVTTAAPGTTPAPSANATTQNGASNDAGSGTAQTAATQSGSTTAAVPPPPAGTSPNTAAGTTAPPAAGANPSATASAPSGAPASEAAGGAMAGNAMAEPPAGGTDHNATAPGQMALTNNPPGTANVVPLTDGNKNDTNAKNERNPNERNPVLANDGLPRAGKVVGSAVYNSSDKKLGSVNDILLGERGHPDVVVLNLAQGDKRVLVPFREFVFGNTRISGNNRVILPNQTPISLAQLAPFHYNLKNDANGNNGVGHRIGSNNAMTAGAVGLIPVGPRPPVTTATNGNESAIGANTMPVAPRAPVTTATNGNEPASAANTVSAPADGDLVGAPIGTATVKASKGEINRNGNANEAALPHQRNPVLADDGLPRASKVIGSTVYNTDDQKVGSIDEILMGEKGSPDQAVLTVNNGNNKRVLVPFKSLVFGNTKINSNNRVILPNQTEASLDHLPPFVYNAANGNNG